ncbi:hypothetical protein [Maribellus luteus]|uniref:hypothetical protein n=1 Tax=Maribellus luteus TaxID=2305463 RepID=UPI0012D7261A|nr:hypothetical protein [Maribellus luteus]
MKNLTRTETTTDQQPVGIGYRKPGNPLFSVLAEPLQSAPGIRKGQIRQTLAT